MVSITIDPEHDTKVLRITEIFWVWNRLVEFFNRRQSVYFNLANKVLIFMQVKITK
jgi:hypothetical protein